jgi:hypothetical protein
MKIINRNLLFFALAIAGITAVNSCTKTNSSRQNGTNILSFKAGDSSTISLVPIAAARQIAMTRTKDSVDVYVSENLSKRPLRLIESEFTYYGTSGYPTFYAFNYSDGGFVLVSAELRATPILAHSEKGAWGKSTFPDGLQYWLRRTEGYVDYLRQKQAPIEDNLQQLWSHLLPSQAAAITGSTAQKGGKTTSSFPVDPCTPSQTYYYDGVLLSTAWGQGCGYNGLCPGNSQGPCSFDLTGCVATAISQVCYYNKYPTSYNYSAMPATATSGSTSVAMETLMANAGQYVNMSYGPIESSAFPSAIVPAFTGPLGYGSASLITYSSSTTPATIENNINFSHPVLLIGYDNTYGGHCWVCDGYEIDRYQNGECAISLILTDYHMNWGWGEIGIGNNYNGWYAIDSWNADGYQFDNNQAAVVNIIP